jgi:hypothetical protein
VLSSGLDLDRLRPVESLQLDRGTQRGRRHRKLDGAVQVVAVAVEDRVRAHDQLDIEITRGPATRTDLALAGQLDPGARVDPRGDLDSEVPASADPPVAGTFDARPRVDGAEAMALRAGPGSHHLTEERPLHLADLTASGAAVTRDHLRAG